MLTKKHPWARKWAFVFAVTIFFSCAIPVSAATDDDEEIEVRRVEMVLDSITVRVNQTRTLYADITPRDADDQTLYWESSDWEIVSVDGDGMITGISPGTAVVTATSENGRVCRCTVTVPGTPIQSDIYIEDIASNDLPQTSITGGEVLRAAALRSDVEEAMKSTDSDSPAWLTYKDKGTVSAAALRGAAYAAESAGGNVAIKLQTLAEDGSIQGQLTIHPENAPSSDENIQVGVYTEFTRVKNESNKAGAHFEREIAVIHLSQQGKFGMEVEVAAKVNLMGISMEDANLYRYADGSYNVMEDSKLWLDQNGFVHFKTVQGGVYILA